MVVLGVPVIMVVLGVPVVMVVVVLGVPIVLSSDYCCNDCANLGVQALYAKTKCSSTLKLFYYSVTTPSFCSFTVDIAGYIREK